MDVRLPNGTIITDVPEGTTKAQLIEKLRRNGYDVSWAESPAAPAAAPAAAPTPAAAPAAAPARPASTRAPFGGLGAFVDNLGDVAQASGNMFLPGLGDVTKLTMGAVTNPATIAHDISEIRKKELPYLFAKEHPETWLQSAKQVGLDISERPALGMQFAANIANAEETARQTYNAFAAKTGLPQKAPSPQQVALTGVAEFVGSKLRGLQTPKTQQELRAASQQNLAAMQAAQERLQAKAPDLQNPILSGVSSGLESLIANAPALAAGLATRSPAIPLAMIGTQTGVGTYGQKRLAGATPEEAALAGGLTGAIEVGTEVMPMGVLVKRLGKAGFSKHIAELLAKDLAGEELATATQNAVDTAIANPDATWEDYRKQLLPNAVQTALATVTQVGAVSAINPVIQRAARLAEKRQSVTPLPVPMQDAEKVEIVGAPPAPPKLAPIPQTTPPSGAPPSAGPPAPGAPGAAPTAPSPADLELEETIKRFEAYGIPHEDAVRFASAQLGLDQTKEAPSVIPTGTTVGGGPATGVPPVSGEAGTVGATGIPAGVGPGGMGGPNQPAGGPDVGEGPSGVPLRTLTPDTFEAAKVEVTNAFEQNKADLDLDVLPPKALADAAKIVAQDPKIDPLDALTSVLEKAEQTVPAPAAAQKEPDLQSVLADKTAPLKERKDAARELINLASTNEPIEVANKAIDHLANQRTSDIGVALEAARQGVTPAKLKKAATTPNVTALNNENLEEGPDTVIQKAAEDAAKARKDAAKAVQKKTVAKTPAELAAADEQLQAAKAKEDMHVAAAVTAQQIANAPASPAPAVTLSAPITQESILEKTNRALDNGYIKPALADQIKTRVAEGGDLDQIDTKLNELVDKGVIKFSTPVSLQNSSELPQSIDHWVETPHSQKGSNPGGVFRNSVGNDYYVKFYANPDQARVEVLAADIHNRLGIPTLFPRLVSRYGKIGVASKWTEGLHQIPLEDYSDPSLQLELANVFVASVLTKHWDPLGDDNTNLLQNKYGILVETDLGGAFHFRAQGGPKEYTPDINEVTTLRDPNINFNTAKAFSHFSAADLTKAIKALRNIEPTSWAEVFKASGLPNWQDLLEAFIARRNALVDTLSAVESTEQKTPESDVEFLIEPAYSGAVSAPFIPPEEAHSLLQKHVTAKIYTPFASQLSSLLAAPPSSPLTNYKNLINVARFLTNDAIGALTGSELQLQSLYTSIETVSDALTAVINDDYLASPYDWNQKLNEAQTHALDKLHTGWVSLPQYNPVLRYVADFGAALSQGDMIGAEAALDSLQFMKLNGTLFDLAMQVNDPMKSDDSTHKYLDSKDFDAAASSLAPLDKTDYDQGYTKPIPVDTTAAYTSPPVYNSSSFSKLIAPFKSKFEAHLNPERWFSAAEKHTKRERAERFFDLYVQVKGLQEEYKNKLNSSLFRQSIDTAETEKYLNVVEALSSALSHVALTVRLDTLREEEVAWSPTAYMQYVRQTVSLVRDALHDMLSSAAVMGIGSNPVPSVVREYADKIHKVNDYNGVQARLRDALVHLLNGDVGLALTPVIETHNMLQTDSGYIENAGSFSSAAARKADIRRAHLIYPGISNLVSDSTGKIQTFYHGSKKTVHMWSPTLPKPEFSYRSGVQGTITFATVSKYAYHNIYSAEESARIYPVFIRKGNYADYTNDTDIQAALDWYRNDGSWDESTENYLRRGAWDSWEKPNMWEDLGWDGAYMYEAGSRNLSIKDGTAVISPFNLPGLYGFARMALGEALPKSAVQAVVDKITGSLKAKLDIRVVQNIDELPGTLPDEIRISGGEDAAGFLAADGKTIYLISDKLRSEADVTALVYHEALGHMGLSALFKQSLDKTLNEIYDGNEQIRNDVADWLKARPNVYGNLSEAERQTRAIEEVLAIRSEQGVLKTSIWDKIVSMIKEFGRKIGMFKQFTDHDVAVILSRAHDKLVNGNNALERAGIRLAAGQKAPSPKPPKSPGAKKVAAANTKISRGLKKVLLSENQADQVAGIATAVGGHDFKYYKEALENWFTSAKSLVRAPIMVITPNSVLTHVFGKDIPQLKKLTTIELQVRGMKASMTKAFSHMAAEYQQFANKNGQKVISRLMNLSRLNRFDVTEHKDLASALKNDGVVQYYSAKAHEPGVTPKQLQAFKGRITVRQREITEVWTAWEALGKQKGGQELFLKMRQFWKDMDTALRTERNADHASLPIDQKSKDLLKKLQGDLDGTTDLTEADDTFPGIPERVFPKIYFPQKRYGKYWVTVKHPKSGVGREFYQYESPFERDEMLRQRAAALGADPNDDDIFNVGNDVASLNKAIVNSSTLLRSMLKIIDDSIVDAPFDTTKYSTADEAHEATKRELKDRLIQQYLLSLPERSLRKQLLHSKNIAGFSMDQLRNFRNLSSAFASQLPKLKYGRKAELLLSEAKDALKGRPPQNKAKLMTIIDEAENRIEDALNPPPADMFTSVFNGSAYLFALTSIASALTQFTAVPYAMNVFNVKYGEVKAGAAFLKFASFWNSMGIKETLHNGKIIWTTPSFGNSKLIKNDPILQKAWNVLNNELDIFQQTRYHTMLTDQPTVAGKTAKGRVGRTVSRTASLARDAMTLAMNTAEQTSRQMIGMMAFYLHYNKTNDFDASIEAAKDMHFRTGDYGRMERPPLMKGRVGKFVFFVRMFPVITYSNMFKDTYTVLRKTSTPSERVDALRIMAGQAMLTGLLAGYLGLPAASLSVQMIHALMLAIMSDDDEDEMRKRHPYFMDNPKFWFEHIFIPDMFGRVLGDKAGHAAADVFLYGPLSVLTKANLSQRLGLDAMFFRQGRDSDTWLGEAQNWIFQNLSPSLAINGQLLSGLQDMANGDFLRGLKEMSPGIVRGRIETARLKTQGAATREGKVVMRPDEFTSGELALQTLGFQPFELAKRQARKFEIDKQIRKLNSERSALLARMNRERAKGKDADPKKIAKIQKDIAEFNRKHPAPELRISGKTQAMSSKRYLQAQGRTVEGITLTRKQKQSLAEDLGD